MRASTTTVQRLREAAHRTARSASTPADRAQLAATSACVTKRSRKEGAEQAVAPPAPPRVSRQVLEAERARLLTRLEENARVLRGMHGTRRAYRLDLANINRLLAALPTAA